VANSVRDVREAIAALDEIGFGDVPEHDIGEVILGFEM
jgi:hypothetical protein